MCSENKSVDQLPMQQVAQRATIARIRMTDYRNDGRRDKIQSGAIIIIKYATSSVDLQCMLWLLVYLKVLRSNFSVTGLVESLSVTGLVESLRIEGLPHLQNFKIMFPLLSYFWDCHVEPLISFCLLWLQLTKTSMCSQKGNHGSPESHYKSIRCSREMNSTVSGPISKRNLNLFKIICILIACKFKKHLINSNRESCHQIFIFLYLKAFIQSLNQISTVVSEKNQFEFLYVHDIGPRSRNDLDLQYSHVFIYSIRCLLLLHFRSLAAIVSTVFTFSNSKA